MTKLPPKGPCDVLIVDDESELVAVYVDFCEDLDLRAIGARSPEEGIHELSVSQPKAMLIDLHMPLLSGVEALERAKNSGAHIPACILATAYSDLDFERACKAGIGLVLRKPFRFDLLGAILKSAIGPRSSVKPRRSVRVTTSMTAMVRDVEFRISDISVGGLALVDDDFTSLNQTEEICILYPHLTSQRSIKVWGERAWQNGGRIGYRFRDPDSKTSGQILRLISDRAQF